ncbi:MAG: hypothetical protein AB1333_03570 [Patescibacteria group bacterium]
MPKEIKGGEKKTPEINTGERKKMFGTGEFILVTLILFFVELIDFFANLMFPIPILGQVSSFIGSAISLTVGAFFQLYIFMKGARGVWTWVSSLGGNMMNSFPILGMFPFAISAWFLIVFIENNPKAQKIASVASGKIGSAIKK